MSKKLSLPSVDNFEFPSYISLLAAAAAASRALMKVA